VAAAEERLRPWHARRVAAYLRAYRLPESQVQEVLEHDWAVRACGGKARLVSPFDGLLEAESAVIALYRRSSCSDKRLQPRR